MKTVRTHSERKFLDRVRRECRIFIFEEKPVSQVHKGKHFASACRPGRACIKVLHAVVSCLTFFTSVYMMNVKFFMHENLTTARNFYKNFP